MLNLHATVRGAIQSVNADISAAYLKSLPYTMFASGRQKPQYAAPVTVQVQVQPPSSRDLKQLEYLNTQGTTRTVFLYSNPEGIDRVNVKGGDLLQFPQAAGAPVDNWLVVGFPEWWDVGTNNEDPADLPASPPTSGWTKLFVVLQTDRPA